MQKELKDTAVDSFDILVNVLKSTSKLDCPNIENGYIFKKSFINVMNSWGAFDATDINKDNKLEISEIR